ncbi:MAG: PIG-L deacetylase family protein [Dehalococcoidia bacterium]
MTEQNKLIYLPEDWQKGLAIAAHPDDLEFGASSAVARWTAQGKEISYAMVTCGEAGIDAMPPAETGRVRAEEERKSARIVGVDTVEFLEHRDGMVEYGLDLRRDLARMIRKYQPEMIVSLNYGLTFGGNMLNMADHRVVGLAALDGARDASNRWIFPELLEEGLEPWEGARMVCFTGSPTPTHGVDVTDVFHLGVASLAAHGVYLSNLSEAVNPDDYLRSFAVQAGAELGCELGVSFEVIWLQV